MITSPDVLMYGFVVSVGAIGLFLGGFLLASLFAQEQIAALTDQAKRSEEEAAAATRRYNDLMDNIAAAVILKNAEGQILFCSPYTEVLTGYARSEIYATEGDFFVSICDESERERLYRSLKVTELGGEPFQFSFQFIHKSGIRMWAETRTVPILEDDEVIATLSVTLDVTASMRYQQQVEEKNRELKAFTSMVSHDLKAPIFTIRGMLEVIAEDFKGELPGSLTEIHSHIERSVDRLERLVSGILDYAKIEARELTVGVVSLEEVMSDVLSDHHHLIQSTGASVSVGTLPGVLGDKIFLTQIFSNLIGNALKYRSPERVCEIAVTAEQLATPAVVKVQVKDNGVGIPHDRLSDVFRPFTRLHGDEIEGTGIGLASVRKITHKLGGTITVSSVVGEGSIFTVTLRGASAP